MNGEDELRSHAAETLKNQLGGSAQDWNDGYDSAIRAVQAIAKDFGVAL